MSLRCPLPERRHYLSVPKSLFAAFGELSPEARDRLLEQALAQVQGRTPVLVCDANRRLLTPLSSGTRPRAAAASTGAGAVGRSTAVAAAPCRRPGVRGCGAERVSERRFVGERAASLFPTLACDPEAGIFLLDDQSLAFGWLCQPLAGADQGHADRLTALVNQEWPTDTLVQLILWSSPDIEAPLALMNGLRTELRHPLLRTATAERAAFLRAGVSAPLIRQSETRVRDV